MEPIAFIPRIAFAGLFLRLEEDGSLRVGPRELVKTHAHLMDGIKAHKEGLTALMRSPGVASAFSPATHATDTLKEQISEFLEVGCVREKKAILSGMNFIMCYFLWAYSNGYDLPSVQQVYDGMDQTEKRGYTEHVVQWVNLKLSDEKRGLIPRFD